MGNKNYFVVTSGDNQGTIFELNTLYSQGDKREYYSVDAAGGFLGSRQLKIDTQKKTFSFKDEVEGVYTKPAFSKTITFFITDEFGNKEKFGEGKFFNSLKEAAPTIEKVRLDRMASAYQSIDL